MCVSFTLGRFLHRLLAIAPELARVVRRLEESELYLYTEYMGLIDGFDLRWLRDHGEHELGTFDEYDGPTAWRVPVCFTDSGSETR